MLLTYLEAIDKHLVGDAALVVYGSAAFMLMGEAERTSLDIDVAAPYSSVDFGDLCQAAEKAGLAVNPEAWTPDDHLKWIAPTRLCLPEPDDDRMLLWQGRRLTVTSVAPAQLVASKLIRYDEMDRGDVRFLCSHASVSHDDVVLAVERLPKRFRDDPVLGDNLAALKTDLAMWEQQP